MIIETVIGHYSQCKLDLVSTNTCYYKGGWLTLDSIFVSRFCYLWIGCMLL